MLLALELSTDWFYPYLLGLQQWSWDSHIQHGAIVTWPIFLQNPHQWTPCIGYYYMTYMDYIDHCMMSAVRKRLLNLITHLPTRARYGVFWGSVNYEIHFAYIIYIKVALVTKISVEYHWLLNSVTHCGLMTTYLVSVDSVMAWCLKTPSQYLNQHGLPAIGPLETKFGEILLETW